MLVFSFSLGEYLLEAFTQVLEFEWVAEVALQDAGSHLLVMNLFEGRTIQIILEFLWAKRSIFWRHSRCWCRGDCLAHAILVSVQEGITLRFHSIVDSNWVLEVVASRFEVVVLNDTTVAFRWVNFILGRSETVSWFRYIEVGGDSLVDMLFERLSGVSWVSCWEHVLSFDAGDETGVTGEALVSDFVGWSINPGFWLLAAHAKDHLVLE